MVRRIVAVDYFLKIDGVPGESADAKHKGEIQLDSFSWGETNTSDPGPVVVAALGRCRCRTSSSPWP